MLMSFVGSVGMLMANSGLEDIMKEALAGVPRVLKGNFHKTQEHFEWLWKICSEVR